MVRISCNNIQHLAAQFMIPPVYRTMPFKSGSQRGYRIQFSLPTFVWYHAAGIPETPLLHEYRTSSSHARGAPNLWTLTPNILKRGTWRHCWDTLAVAHRAGPLLGNEKRARSFFAQTFWTPPGVRDIPAKFPGHPGFLSSKPKEDKVSRAGTKFSATTPSRGRPPPHQAVSGPKNLIFVLFFLAWTMAPQQTLESRSYQLSPVRSR